MKWFIKRKIVLTQLFFVWISKLYLHYYFTNKLKKAKGWYLFELFNGSIKEVIILTSQWSWSLSNFQRSPFRALQDLIWWHDQPSSYPRKPLNIAVYILSSRSSKWFQSLFLMLEPLWCHITDVMYLSPLVYSFVIMNKIIM